MKGFKCDASSINISSSDSDSMIFSSSESSNSSVAYAMILLIGDDWDFFGAFREFSLGGFEIAFLLTLDVFFILAAFSFEILLLSSIFLV